MFFGAIFNPIESGPCSFPDSSLASPIVLCSKENNNVSLGIDKEVPAFPALPNLVSVENDATLAKSACAVGYAYRYFQ